MTTTEITCTETWATEKGPYGEGREYQVCAYVEHRSDGEDAGSSCIRVDGTIYTYGAGGAIVSQDPYEDYEVQWLTDDELESVDEETLRVAIRESLGIGWGDGPYQPEADQDRYDESGAYTGRTLTRVTD